MTPPYGLDTGAVIKINMDLQCVECNRITHITPEPATGRIDPNAMQHEPGCNSGQYKIVGWGSEPLDPRSTKPRKII